MKAIDRIFGSLVIGFIIPITGLCIFWWGSYLLKFNIIYSLTAGLVLGIMIDMVMLPKLVSRMYSFNTIILVTAFVIYSIGIFGFFMGVPVFNIIAGIMAAFYIGRKMRIAGADKTVFRVKLAATNRFSALILIVICVCSAYIAINDPYTGANLEGMLSLDFKVTKEMIWGVILIGGACLTALQYFVSVLIGRLAYRMSVEG